MFCAFDTANASVISAEPDPLVFFSRHMSFQPFMLTKCMAKMR